MGLFANWSSSGFLAAKK